MAKRLSPHCCAKRSGNSSLVRRKRQHHHNTNSQVNVLGATVGDAEHLSVPHPSDCGHPQQLWPVIKALLKRDQMTSQNKLSAKPRQPLGADAERAVTTGE